MTSSVSLYMLSALLGVVGTYITQFLKTQTLLIGKGAMALTIGVSLVLGAIAAFLAGELFTQDLFAAASTVLSLSTIAYKFLNVGATVSKI